MTPEKSDAKDFDWSPVERAVEAELLDRARRVARRITDRVRWVTEDAGRGRPLDPNDPTDVCPAVV